MAWRDDYRPGAFRGVPFHLKSSSSTGGRRTVLNEFPLRDEPMTEDMGRRARKFQLSMTVIGPDYMAQRDRLIEALETAGPGTLMHPFRGELLVAVIDDYSCEESTEQGGLARISVTFVEAGELPRPDSQLAQGSVGNIAADALQADALAEFEEDFSVVGWASFVGTEAETMLGEATAAVADAVGYAEGLAGSAIGTLQGVTGEIMSAGGLLEGSGTFGSLYRRLTGSIQQLILSPGNLGLQVLGLVRSISSGTGNPLQALMAQMRLFGLSDKVKRVSSSSAYQPPARAQLATNQAAVYRLIERAAVSEAVRLAVSKPGTATASQPAPGVSFDNRDQAVEIRDQVLEELDRQQLAASPQRYRQLAVLSAALVSEMNLRAANLVPLTRVTPATTIPALLLAHRLYGDARQAEQIVTRNRLVHPGFVQGGVELEVLKNA
jgi:prophage DNA circulation protein